MTTLADAGGNSAAVLLFPLSLPIPLLFSIADEVEASKSVVLEPALNTSPPPPPVRLPVAVGGGRCSDELRDDASVDL